MTSISFHLKSARNITKKKKKSKITIWTLYLQILMWPFPIWIYWLCQVKHGRRLCVQPSSLPSFCTFCLHGDRQEESRSLLIVRMRNSLFRFLRWVQLRFVEVISQLKDNAIQNLGLSAINMSINMIMLVRTAELPISLSWGLSAYHIDIVQNNLENTFNSGAPCWTKQRRRSLSVSVTSIVCIALL